MDNMQVTTDDAVAQLSGRGRVEWELALTKAANQKLHRALEEIKAEVRSLQAQLPQDSEEDEKSELSPS